MLENWDAIPGAAFDIWLSTSDPAAPLPAEWQTSEDGARYVSKMATKDSPSGGFGAITYTKPGEYTYSLYEKTPTPDKQELGIDYSMAVYRAIVTVADNGTGRLSASVGEYTYSLYEKTPTPDKQELGIDYSMAVYRAIVTVADNGTGRLSASVSMVQTVDDQGVDIDPYKTVALLTATFTNRYDLASSIEGLRANKVLVDASGSGRVLRPAAG